MDTSTSTQMMIDTRPVSLESRQKAGLAVLCLGAGLVALATRYVPSGLARIGYGLLVTALFLVLALAARRHAALRRFWELPFAFFVFSAFVLLDNTVPPWVGTTLLHDSPIAGNPLAATLRGSVIVQLFETLLGVAVVVGLTKASGGTLRSIYLQVGRFGWAMLIGIAGFVLFYLLLAAHPSSQFFPTHGTVTLSRYLALTPALLVAVLANGFLEEVVFRGLFLQKYNAILGPYLANVVQALIFALAHVGVNYTPFALLFIVVFVFPLGLIAGSLMRNSNGIIASSLFHAGADIPIYLAFLTFVS